MILGRADADLVIRGGRVLSTTHRTLREGALAIAGGRIAGIHEEPEAVIGPETDVLDVDGSVIAPGFIDAHTHLDLHQTVDTAYPESLEGGTTTLVSEVAAFGPGYGATGVRTFLDSTRSLPVRVFVTLPPQRFFDLFESPRGSDADREELLSLLENDRVVGVGETAWIRMVGRESGATPLYERAAALGKTVSGHGAGVSGQKLQAFGAIVTDDHEAISGDGIRDRVEAGIHTIGRYGSIRDDMDALVDAATDIDASELSLSTDGMWPRELVEEGHMDAVIRRVIEGGVDPVDALVMATRSPARHFGLDGLGTLTPATPADIVVLDDLESVQVAHTIVAGDHLVEEGESRLPDPEPYDYPAEMTSLPDLSFGPGDFAVEAPSTGPEVRAIAYDGGLLSGETTVTPTDDGGTLHPDPGSDVLKLALFDRTHDGDRGGFVGFVQGFGLDTGAVATTATWEKPGLLVLGTDEESMARAANRVVSLDGGWVVFDGDTVTAEMATPVGGTCAVTPPAETAAAYEAIEAAIHDLGATVDRPMLGLQTISFYGVPSLKIAFTGYADVLGGQIVGLDPS